MPCFASDKAKFTDLIDYKKLSNRLSGRVVRSLFDEIIESTDTVASKRGNGSEVKVYMIDRNARELFGKVGQLLVDLAKLKNVVSLPETEEELISFVSIVVRSLKTGEPITFFTPVCPDWSRDRQGRYDFKSLGGGESFIANKFFVNAPELLDIFRRNNVAYRGVILFADWGLETEIEAKGTYGQKLSSGDVSISFASTFAATDQTLKVLQEDPNTRRLFAAYQLVSMKEFLRTNIDVDQAMVRMRYYFTTEKKGIRLLEVLDNKSLEINGQRLGVSKEENREVSLRNLIEYSTVGQAIGDNSMLIVCESKVTSAAYNLPRGKNNKVPTFYVKGREKLGSGVNIL